MRNYFLTCHRLRAAMAAFILLGAVGIARADAMEELLQSLKGKGVIGEADYRRIAAEREAEKKQAAGTRPDVVAGNFKDAIIFSSADGANTMQLTGRLQADYRAYTNKAEPNTSEMRRVQLGVKGKFWDNVKYNVTAHLNNVGANGATSTGIGGPGALEEAWLEPMVRKQATLRLGMFYTPFSLEDANSSKYIDFMERPAIINQSQSTNDSTDTGVMLYGMPVDGVAYWLAHTNGASRGVTNANVAGGRETSIRGVMDLARVFEQKGAVYHVGLDYSRGRKPGPVKDAQGKDVLNGGAEIGKIRTEGRSASFKPMKLIWSNADNNYIRTRQALELAWASGPLKVQGEVVSENYEGATLAGIGYNKMLRGHYADLMWMITGEKYADSYSNGSFGSIRPYRNFVSGGEGWGAWEIGLRYSRLDAGDLNSATGLRNDTGYADGMKTTTLGLKWIMNPNTRMLFNVVHSKYGQPTRGGTALAAPISSDTAYMMRGQFDF